jgi:hypothetical protein
MDAPSAWSNPRSATIPSRSVPSAVRPCPQRRARVRRAHDVIDLLPPRTKRSALQVVQIEQLFHARRCGYGHWAQARPNH